MFSLVFILNLLSELEFFKDIEIGINFTLLLSLLNSPSMIFEMFPFIFLLTTQFFFIKLFNNNELEVFKYSGLKNSNILWVLSLLSLSMSIIIIIVFYNFSANFKNFYLEKNHNILQMVNTWLLLQKMAYGLKMKSTIKFT